MQAGPHEDAYRARFRRVLDYVDAHLDEELSLTRLSGVAAFSKYHFHRQFSELFGLAVHRYVQLVRMRRAGYQLAFREQRVIEIALASGYESHEAFSRAFKKLVGQSPSEFREQPDWVALHETFQPLSKLRMEHMPPDHRAHDVRIVDFPETRVGVVEHRGDPRLLGQSIQKLIAWRKRNHLPPRVSATFNILYDDPDQTPPEAYRMDLCVAAPHPIADNELGVIAKTIPAGRCAVLRHVGSDTTLGASFSYLYATWLPVSGHEPRDFPLFLQRVRFYPEVPEHETEIDIFVPLV